MVNLKTLNGEVVTDKKQALAIAMSESEDYAEKADLIEDISIGSLSNTKEESWSKPSLKKDRSNYMIDLFIMYILIIKTMFKILHINTWCKITLYFN